MKELATFAGGCFWCMEPPYKKIDGVISILPGYTGGHTENPTYEEVCSGKTGHAEAVEITFDPEKVSYEKLLDIFWHSIDPTTKDKQFCDVGNQYRTAIFYHNEEQKKIAEHSKAKLQNEMAVVTEIVPATTFYPAEEYHREFYKKNPQRYEQYSYFSGRKERLKELWEK